MKKTIHNYFLYLLVLWSASLLFSCHNKATVKQELGLPVGPDSSIFFTIIPGRQVGLITLENSSMEDVLAAYGKNARKGNVHLGEDDYGPGIILFPDDEKRKIEIYWDEGWENMEPSFFRIQGENSVWKTDSGITLGTSLVQVERINDVQFVLWGFGWEFGGLVVDWNKGRLEDLNVSFSPGPDKKVPAELLGQRQITSDNYELRQLNPVVSSIVLGLWKTQADLHY